MKRRSWLMLEGACVVGGVALAAAQLDRPLALFMEYAFGGTQVEAAINAGLGLLLPTTFVAAILAAIAVARRDHLRPRRWLERYLNSALSTGAAVLVAVALKHAIGRSQVDPGFLMNHVYTVRPFSASQAFAAFPSATMAGVSAAVFGARVPAWLSGAIIVMIAAALIATNSHWLSDLIGGLYVGHLASRAVLRTRRPTLATASQGMTE
jgi:hypothetical protein